MDFMGKILKSQLAYMEGYGNYLHEFRMRTWEHLKKQWPGCINSVSGFFLTFLIGAGPYSYFNNIWM